MTKKTEFPTAPGVKLSAIPKYSDHMTLAEFEQACKDGMLTDDDGSCVYATFTQVTDLEVTPSHVADGQIDNRFTHVCWYNK